MSQASKKKSISYIAVFGGYSSVTIRECLRRIKIYDLNSLRWVFVHFLFLT